MTEAPSTLFDKIWERHVVTRGVAGRRISSTSICISYMR